MSDYKYEEATALDAAAALSIGNALRSAREARGETVLDVAHALKLAPKQVEALELERFDLLPGRAFVRGFLRNYARHLGLDGDRLVARLTDSSAGNQPSVELSPPKNARGTLPTGSVSPSKAPRSIVALIVVVGVALGVGWYFDWFKISEVGRGGAGREAARSATSETLVAAPFVTQPSRSEEPAAVAVDTSARAGGAASETPPPPASLGETSVPAAAVGAPAAAAEPVPSVPVAAPVVNAGAQAEQHPAPARAAAEGQAVPASPAVPDAVASQAGQLLFRLRGESWIQVRDASGNTIYMGTGAAGTTRTVQGTPPFAVVVGNATHVAMEHAGKPVDLTPHIRTGVARLTVE